MLRVRADGPTMQTVRQCRREVRDGPTMQTGDVLMCMLVEMTGTAVRRRTMARRSRLYCRRLSGRAKRGYPPSRNPKPERNPAAKWAKPETQAPRKSETRNPNPGETPLRADRLGLRQHWSSRLSRLGVCEGTLSVSVSVSVRGHTRRRVGRNQRYERGC